MALGIGGKAKSGLVDRAVLADAGEDVLQFLAFGGVVEDVAEGDERQPARLGKGREPGKAVGVVAAIKMMCAKIGACGKIRRDTMGKGGDVTILRRQDDQDL